MRMVSDKARKEDYICDKEMRGLWFEIHEKSTA